MRTFYHLAQGIARAAQGFGALTRAARGKHFPARFQRNLAGGVSARHGKRIISGAQVFFERVLVYVTFRLERAHHEDDAYELGLIDVASYPYVASLEAAPTLEAAQD